MTNIPMNKDKWNAFRSTLKDSIRSLKKIHISGKSLISDKNIAYKRLNSALENILLGRKMYIEAAARQRLRLPIKEIVASFDKVCNQLQTLLETIETGTATGDMIYSIKKKTIVAVADSYQSVKDQIKITSSKESNVKVINSKNTVEAEDWKDKLGGLKDQIKDDKGLTKADKEKLQEQIKKENMQTAIREARSLFAKNRRYIMRIPNAKTDENSLEIIELPVIGIYKPFYFKEDFIRAGIETDNVGYYLVIHDQVIVGLNLRELFEKGLTTKKYLMQVLKSLSSRIGRRYVLVSDKPFKYKDYGFNFYWIMEERVLNKLTHGGEKQFQVLNWGFAL